MSETHDPNDRGRWLEERQRIIRNYFHHRGFDKDSDKYDDGYPAGNEWEFDHQRYSQDGRGFDVRYADEGHVQDRDVQRFSPLHQGIRHATDSRRLNRFLPWMVSATATVSALIGLVLANGMAREIRMLRRENNQAIKSLMEKEQQISIIESRILRRDVELDLERIKREILERHLLQ